MVMIASEVYIPVNRCQWQCDSVVQVNVVESHGKYAGSGNCEFVTIIKINNSCWGVPYAWWYSLHKNCGI